MVIVAGGDNGKGIQETEVLDFSSQEWQLGPNLPKGNNKQFFLSGPWPYCGIVEPRNMTWNKNGLLVYENSSPQFFYHYFFLISKLVLCKLHKILNGIENN